MQAGGCQAVHAGGRVFDRITQVDAAGGDERHVGVDGLELRHVGDELLKPAAKGQVMIEREHRLAQPQPMRERAAYRKRLDIEGLGAGHELAGGKHLAQRVHGMHGIHRSRSPITPSFRRRRLYWLA